MGTCAAPVPAMTAPRHAVILLGAALALGAPAPAAAGPARRPPDATALRRAVARQKPAFDACLTRQARALPWGMNGRRAILRLTIQPTGRVGHASLDPGWLEARPLGRCLVDAGRRLVVAPFAGEAVGVDVPLLLSVAR